MAPVNSSHRNVELTKVNNKKPDIIESNGEIKKVPLEDENIESVHDIVGEWGPHQRFVMIVATLLSFAAAFQNNGIVFYSDKSDFWCKKPLGYENAEKQTCRSYQDPNGTKCNEWEYDKSFYSATIFTEFDLVCDRSWYISASKSVYQVGYLVSSVLFGWMSDRHGRQLAFRTSVATEFIFGVSQALSMNIEHFLLSRFLMGVGAYARYLTGMLIVLEWAGPRVRARVKTLRGVGWNHGNMAVPVFFYGVRNFRYMQGLVCLYQLMLGYWIWKTPESPTWILIYGKPETTENLLVKACKVNKTFTEEEVKRKLAILKHNTRMEESERMEESKKSLFDLWKSKVMLKYSLCFYVIWFSLGFIGYGFSYNLATIGGNLYINTFIVTSLELVMRIVMYFIIDRFERKTFFYVFTFSGVISIFLMIPFIYHGEWGTPYRIFFALFGSLMISGAFTHIYLQAAEVFPTGFRQIGVGSCAVASRIGAVLAPFIKELAEVTHLVVPFTIFGILGLISGCLMYFIPETKDKPIPNTIKEAEETGRRKSVDE